MDDFAGMFLHFFYPVRDRGCVFQHWAYIACVDENKLWVLELKYLLVTECKKLPVGWGQLVVYLTDLSQVILDGDPLQNSNHFTSFQDVLVNAVVWSTASKVLPKSVVISVNTEPGTLLALCTSNSVLCCGMNVSQLLAFYRIHWDLIFTYVCLGQLLPSGAHVNHM